MSYTFSLGRVPGEAAALRGIVAGPEIASRTRAAGMSNKQVASFASSPGSFRALMNPNLPVNNLVTPSVEIFDQPASNFTDVTRQVKDAIRAKRTAPPTRPPSSLTSPLLKSQAVVQQPEPQHKDPFLQRLNNLYLVNEYLEHFGPQIASLEIKKESLNKMSNEELASLVSQIRIILGSTQSCMMIKSSIDTAVTIAESIATNANFKVNGLANILKSDEEWMKLCKEAELAYMDTFTLSVEQRLIYKMSLVGYQMHKTNELGSAIAPNTTLVPEEFIEEFGDLIE